MELEQYVSSLDLQLPPAAFPPPKRIVRTPTNSARSSEQSFLADKSLVSFASGVGAQSRQDILNCTLIAQLAANKKAPGDDQPFEWYDAFIAVLINMGWIVEEGGINTYQADDTLVSLENVIVDILTTAFGATYIALIKKTLEAVKKLGDSDGKITAFERNTLTASKGFFQIATVVEEGGIASMQLGTFLLTSTNKIRKILFIDFSGNHTRLDYVSRRATFNQDAFSAGRVAVEAKLKNLVSDYITRLDI